MSSSKEYMAARIEHLLTKIANSEALLASQLGCAPCLEHSIQNMNRELADLMEQLEEDE